MATKTKNYALTKPAETEAADIAVVNVNMDILDTELKKTNDALSDKSPSDHNHDNRYFTESEINQNVLIYQPRYLFDVVVDILNWQDGSTVVPNFPYAKNVPLAGVTINDSCITSPSDVTSDLGILALQNDSYAGGITLYSREIPKVNLEFNMIRIERVKA